MAEKSDIRRPRLSAQKIEAAKAALRCDPKVSDVQFLEDLLDFCAGNEPAASPIKEAFSKRFAKDAAQDGRLTQAQALNEVAAFCTAAALGSLCGDHLKDPRLQEALLTGASKTAQDPALDTSLANLATRLVPGPKVRQEALKIGRKLRQEAFGLEGFMGCAAIAASASLVRSSGGLRDREIEEAFLSWHSNSRLSEAIYDEPLAKMAQRLTPGFALSQQAYKTGCRMSLLQKQARKRAQNQ